MALPLPSVIANVGPGGSIVSSMAGINALRKSMLENQYYGPNIQSEIAQRNALANKLNTMTPLEAEQMRINNQYLPEHLRAANVFSNLQNQYYAPNILSEIAQRQALASHYNTMTPLQARELQLKNQYYAPEMQSQIANRNALTNQAMIQNQFLPESLRLGNEEATLKNKYYAPKAEADIAQSRALTDKYNTMTPLEAREAMIRNYFLPENLKAANTLANLTNQYYAPKAQADIAQSQALTNKYNTMTPLEAKELQIRNNFLPDQLKAANTLANLNNQYFVPKTEADIAQTRALTDKYNQMTPLEVEAQKLRNQFYPDLTKSQIEASKALSNIRGMGGVGLGTGGKEQLFFQNLVQRDNPNFTPEQAYQASNLLQDGSTTLPDGTPINQSAASKKSLDRLVKYGTTGPLITGNIRAAQAESEINELTKHAQAGWKPYGETFLNYSPLQVLDTFKNDNASQERLGKFIASQQLQYEITQNEIKLNAGMPGVTTTQELMDLGQQRMNALYPRLSAKARKAAQDYFVEGLEKALKARQGVNIGASNVYGDRPKIGSNKSNTAPKATLRYNPQTGDFEEIK